MNNEEMNIDLQPVEYDPFGGPEITKVIPAIEPQLEIWTACHIGGADASRAYIESVSMRMTGAFNRQAIERALKAVVNRHESLRSVFSTDGTDMLVYAEIDANIQYGDLSALVPQEQNEYIDNFIKENGLLPFDLVAGPLFRCSLFELSHSECYLTFSAHHIICDGWSLGIILQDLSRYYNAFISGGIPEIPAAPSFSSYADAQREFIGSIEYAHTEKYWLSQYEDSVPAVEMPLDFPRPVIRTYKSTRVDYALDVPTVLALKAIGIKAGCSFATTLISAFEIFIQKLTKQHDIVLAIPAAGQSATGNTGLVGHCVNLLPFRSSYNGTTTFTGYLKDRKSRILDSYEYQQLTFGTLLKKLNIPRDPSRVPMVPVVFNIDMGLDNGVAFSGLEYKLNYNPRQYETFELFLNVSGSEKELVFEWSYNCRLFTELSIEAMMSDFKALLSFFIQQPDLKIADIPVFRQDEIKVNPTENNTVEYPKEKTIHELIQDSAELYPDNTAVFFNGQSFSYKNINQTANQLAVLLQINGVKPGEVVAIALERSPEMVMALLAVLKAGAVYLPLDPAYPKERVEYMLEDAKAKVLLTSKKFEGSFTTSATSLYMEDARIRLPRYSFENAVSPVKGNALAYIIYTSGSTGKPKGVQIEHSSVVNLLLSMQNKPGITAADRLLAITTIAFDIAGLELYLPLITGACVVLADTDAAKDGRLLAALVKSEGVTIMQATPSMWRIMLESGDYNALPAKILCGGEPMGVDLAARLLPRCQSLWNLYGPTETTIWSTVKQVVMDNDALLIGKPINNTRIYIYDELLQALPAGETGDIFIGGDGLSRGYVGKPDITALVFTEHTLPDGTKEKIYRTGDTGKWTPDGDIQYIGRSDNQLKIRGFRIEPGEIENLLLSQEDISEAAVVAKDNRLLAF
ncbi:MAG: amino acid adenylation domain-containing protein, partial [Taibaiella sp.]|nr:amino acid adenylation domain-containing protein [Taibaiella sp.]